MNALSFHRFASLLTATAAVFACMLALPALSLADYIHTNTAATTYANTAADTYANTASGCISASIGSGSADENGTLYLACDASIIRYSSSGRLLPTLVLPATSTDVVPAPDGSFIYLFQNGTTVRYDHQVATDTFVKNTAWKTAIFAFDGTAQPVVGRYIAVDAWGDLYISNGAGAQVIVKLHSDGSFVTAFGGSGDGIGEFGVNMGVAVSRDGRTVYVADQSYFATHTNKHNTVQRFDYDNGEYTHTANFGDGTQDLTCAQPGAVFSSPYDVGIDPWGFVYVMDTSCLRVKKFTGAGVYVGIVAAHNVNINPARPHGLAVGRHGEFYVGQWGQLFTRTAGNPEPGPIPAITPLPAPVPPDVTAPVLESFTIPANTATRAITIGIAATDDVGVTSMRFANEDGNWSGWIDYATSASTTLTADYGDKGVTAQVRDAAGNESATIYASALYRAPDAPAAGNDVTIVRPTGSSSRARTSRGAVTVPKTTVYCAATASAACNAKGLLIETVRTGKGNRTKFLRLDTTSFSVTPGTHSAIRVKLSRKTVAALRKARQLKTRLTLTVTAPNGSRQTAIVTFLLVRGK